MTDHTVHTAGVAPNGATAHSADGVLAVENLHVSFGDTHVVQGVSFTLHAGRVTAVVGESGSGKSVTARALVGLAGQGARVTVDSLRLGGADVRALSEREWRARRGVDVGFVLQDALSSIDPLRTVGDELDATLRVHGVRSRTQRLERSRAALAGAGLADTDRFLSRRPDQLSGGQRQRALIALALLLDPPVIIADEPTTALDATVQAQILDQFAALAAAGKAILLISHDLGVVTRLADEVLVMRAGEVVDQGPVREVLSAPRSGYTRELLAAVPRPQRRGRLLLSDAEVVRSAAAHGDEVALSAHALSKNYRLPGGRVEPALNEVSLTLAAGRTLGIVGESGSGKSTLAWVLAGLNKPDSGEVTVGGRAWVPGSDRTRADRRGDVQVVYQNPLASFDPRHTVDRVLDDALAAGSVSRAERRLRIAELLEAVGLDPVLGARRPLTLSGGQRQRLAIARALARDPRVLILDEPVSALDVSIQATILDLLLTLQVDRGLSYIFVSHDLGVVYHVSDEVMVLKDGDVVEYGDAHTVLTEPRTEYTRELVSAIADLPDWVSP